MLGLLRCQEERGLEMLLQEYGGRTMGALSRDFGGSLDHDAIQAAIYQAAYRAWRSIDTFDERRGSLRVWFFAIARNCALRILEQDAKQRGGIQLSDWASVTRPAPLRSAREGADIRKLRACVESLPPLQKAVIEADFASGDVADAGALARQHSTSKNSIYVSRVKARKKLKRALEGGSVSGFPETLSDGGIKR